MGIENLFRYTALAVGLKPSAMQGKARLRGLYRIISSKTIISAYFSRRPKFISVAAWGRDSGSVQPRPPGSTPVRTPGDCACFPLPWIRTGRKREERPCSRQTPFSIVATDDHYGRSDARFFFRPSFFCMVSVKGATSVDEETYHYAGRFH